jgi:hypothetical protein
LDQKDKDRSGWLFGPNQIKLVQTGSVQISSYLFLDIQFDEKTTPAISFDYWKTWLMFVMLENLQDCLYIYLFLKKFWMVNHILMANTVIVVKVEIKKNC